MMHGPTDIKPSNDSVRLSAHNYWRTTERISTQSFIPIRSHIPTVIEQLRFPQWCQQDSVNWHDATGELADHLFRGWEQDHDGGESTLHRNAITGTAPYPVRHGS